MAVVHCDHELLEQRLRDVLGDAGSARLRLAVHQLAEIACAQRRGWGVSARPRRRPRLARALGREDVSPLGAADD